MIARLTRLLLLIQIVAVVLLGALVAGRFGLSFAVSLSYALVVLILVRLLVVANNFRIAWHYGKATCSIPRLGIRRGLALFFGEFIASMFASSWLLPFCAFSQRAPAPSRTLPVLLVHGYGCNSGYWRPFGRVLRKAGIGCNALDLEPAGCGIDDYADAISEAVERMCRESKQAGVVIVAHSMGGLAARAYLRRHGADRIAKIVTLGTPHHGTALARFGFGVNTAQMRWTANEQEGLASEWLRSLAADEDSRHRSLLVSIYSRHDNIVAPQTSARLEGALNIELEGIGHVALGLARDVQERAIQEILSAARPAGVTTSQPCGSDDTGRRISGR